MANGTFTRVADQSRTFTTWDLDSIPAPPINPTTTFTKAKVQWSDTIDSGRNPRYRQQIRDHENATTHNNRSRLRVRGHYTGMAETNWVRKSNSKRLIRRRASGYIISDADNNPFTSLPPYSNSSLKAKIVNRTLAGFLNACRSAQTTFEGGVFVGEIKEVLQTILRPGKGIRTLINGYSRDLNRRTRRMRRGGRIDPARVTDANKVISDTWLEYSFGLRPLLADAKSGAEALARLALNPAQYKRASYALSEFLPDSDLSPSGFDNYIVRPFTGIRYNVYLRGKMGIKCKMTGEVRCKVENPMTMRSEVLGFNPSNFLPTVYNLIPYSWLVDYFTNLGDCINAWTFPLADISWWSRSTISTREREIVAHMIQTGVSDPGVYRLGDWRGDDFHILLDRSYIERDATTLGIPTIRFQIPGLSMKWANLGALLHMRSF